MQDDEPRTWVPAGRTELVGTLMGDPQAAWTVPDAFGPIVATDAQGQTLAVVRDGTDVRLGEAEEDEQAPLQIQVWRKLSTGVPRDLTTVVRLQGGTEGQPVDVGAALPEGFAAYATEGPVTLTAQGHWRIAAGQSVVTVRARCTDQRCADPAQLTVGPPALKAPWPTTEVWSLDLAQGAYPADWRSLAPAADPRANGVPTAWQGWPATALKAGQTVAVTALVRPPAPTALMVEHRWMLDADRAHWLAVDTVRGTVGAPWRLVPAAGSHLGQVVSPDGVEQVSNRATGDTSEGDGGIPWGHTTVALQAVRMQAAGAPLSAVGWQTDATQVSGSLRAPPDVRVLHVSGPDGATNTWVSNWTLIQVFLGALFVGLIGRVLGWKAGILAVGYVALATPTLGTGAPFFSLALGVALTAVWPWVRQQRWRWVGQTLLTGVGLVLLIQTALFTRAQWEGVFHPQLDAAAPALVESLWAPRGGLGANASHTFFNRHEDSIAEAGVYTQIDPAPTPAAPVAPMAAPRLQRVAAPAPLAEAMMVAPSPAGWGAPVGEVAFPEVHVTWDGPVRANETFRVWWLGPLGLAIWRLLTLFALGGLLIRLGARWTRAHPGTSSWSSTEPHRGTGPKARRWPATWLGAGLVLWPLLGVAQTTPDPATLAALAARLNAPPRCAPDCARWQQAAVRVEGTGVTWTLQAEADQPATLAVPQPGNGVILDGGASQGETAVFTDAGQAVTVGAGVTTVTLHYRVSGGRWNWTLDQPGLPVTVIGTDVGVEGVQDGALSEATLTLVPAQAVTAAAASAVHPYVHLQRELSLTDRWRVTTTATLVGTASTPVTVVVPLLPGEKAITAPEVTAQGVRLTVRDTQPTVRWTSEVPAVREWRWTAPNDPTVVTGWTIVASPWWQVALSGVTRPMTGPGEGWAVTPFPGQTVVLAAEPLKVRPGVTVAVDQATLTSTPGQRMSTQVLQMTVRAHGAQAWPLQLPENATLISVTVGEPAGEPLPLTLAQGTLVLPVTDGTAVWTVTFRLPTGQGVHWATPAVGWQAPTVNARVDPGLNAGSRWVLAAQGPGVGPAFTLWSSLGLALLVAWGLSRWPGRPLSFGMWAGLAAGTILANGWAWLVLAGFLLAMEAKGRRSWGLKGRWVLRVILAGWAIVALIVLIVTVGQGLMGNPHAWTAVANEGAVWLLPSSTGGLPAITVWSAPMWLYRGVLLLWSLWLAWAVIGWGRRAFRLWLAP
jgi:hypothetical protein